MSQTEVQLIKDAVIVNADVSNSAAIDVSKISGAMPLTGGTFTNDVTFDGETAGRDIIFDRSANALEFADNAKAMFGASDDLEIFHSGTHSIIKDSGTGNLQLAGSLVQITNEAISASMLVANAGGSVELNHNGSKKFETVSTGVVISGKLETTGFLSVAADNQDLKVGAGDDLRIFHDGTDSRIYNATGDLVLRSASYFLNSADGSENIIKGLENGAVELYHNNSKKFETTSAGVSVTGALTSTGLTVNGGTSPATIDHTGGNALELTRSSKTLAFNANFGAANTHAAINISSGMELRFQINAADKIKMTTAGDWVPTSDNARNLGATSLRWANIYTTDLKLSNEGSQNDVDATWGNYTIQEGHEDLFLINHRTGKKFKFNLTEVA